MNNFIPTDRVSTTILGYTNGIPQDDSLLLSTIKKETAVNNKYVIATNLMKKSVNIGEAIVEFASHTGIAGFKFNLPKREQVKMQSEITDHYTDANNAIQDHIARKPITITMNGLQGEYFYSVNPFEDTLAQITPILALVKQFIPKLPDRTKNFLADKYKSITGKTETPELLKTGDTKTDINRIDVFALFQDLYKLKSAQTRAFLFFEALWKSEALFTVETTWKRYDNMAIIDLTPVRDENADITDFTVTFKQMHFAVTKITNLENYTGRTRQELSAVANKGVDKGKKVEV
jgi:hypothetical protein